MPCRQILVKLRNTEAPPGVHTQGCMSRSTNSSGAALRSRRQRVILRGRVATQRARWSDTCTRIVTITILAAMILLECPYAWAMRRVASAVFATRR